MTKTIGQNREYTPEENLTRLEKLNNSMRYIHPVRKKKQVLRFKTWEELYQYNLKRAAEEP